VSDSKKLLPVDFQNLEEYCFAITQERDSLLKEAQVLKEKVKHLESLLTKSLPVIGDPDDLSPEYNIAEIELKRLMEKSIAGTLTLEEIKKYDILVKNKRLSLDKPTQNNRVRHVKEEAIDVTDLAKLAGGTMVEDE
jgi:hypothetical protein